MGGWQGARKDPAYGSAAWKRARAACLKRAGWRCELRLPGCQGTATEADHIRGLAADPGHTALRAVCRSCHGKRTAEQARAAKREQQSAAPFVPRTRW